MDYYQAIATQPANLAASYTQVREALASNDLSRWRTGVLGVTSIGASSHAGHVFAHRMISAGRRVILIDAAEIAGYGSEADLADSYVFVTEGGRSRETIEAAELVAGRPRLALTNVPHAPIAQAVDTLIGLGHGDDSGVYTVGYTATLQAFGLLAETLTGRSDGDDWTALPDVIRRLLDELTTSGAIPTLAKQFVDLSNIDYVGSGATLSSVQEGALMTREAPRINASAYETYQYLHGPMEAQRSSTGCVLFGGDREIALSQFAARHEIPTLLLTAQDVAEEPNLSVIRLPQLAPFSASIAQIVVIQVLIGELTRLRGFEINEFIYDQDDTKVGPPLAGEGH